jgi:hypothetical protein
MGVRGRREGWIYIYILAGAGKEEKREGRSRVSRRVLAAATVRFRMLFPRPRGSLALTPPFAENSPLDALAHATSNNGLMHPLAILGLSIAPQAPPSPSNALLHRCVHLQSCHPSCITPASDASLASRTPPGLASAHRALSRYVPHRHPPNTAARTSQRASTRGHQLRAAHDVPAPCARTQPSCFGRAPPAAGAVPCADHGPSA